MALLLGIKRGLTGLCSLGKGIRKNRRRSFPKNSVDLLKWSSQGIGRVWLIGKDEEWDIPL